MVNRQATAAARLIDRVKARAAETVLYRRGGTAVSGLSAVLGSSEHESSDDYGTVTKSNSKDFVFDLSDLVTALSAVSFDRPQKDDEIEWDGMIYAVLPFGDDYVWSWNDEHEVSIKVHTKETVAVV